MSEATPERNDVLAYQALQDLGQDHCPVDHIQLGRVNHKEVEVSVQVGAVVNGHGFGSLPTTTTINSTEKAG